MSYNPVNAWYRATIDNILIAGEEKKTRNGITFRLKNLQHTFTNTPLITLRKTAWKNALREMEWFLSGSINIDDLHPSVKHWWSPWADELGRIKNHYGQMFKWWSWETFFRNTIHEKVNPRVFHTEHHCDSIEYLISEIEKDSRRAVITTWNTGAMADPSTPITTCHGTVIQCFVNNDDTLDMTMYQRSADFIVGVPHNLIQYWALLMWLAHRTDKKIGTFTWIGGDVHIYQEHIPLAEKISEKDSMQDIYQLQYNTTGEKFKASDFSFEENPLFLIDESAKLII